MSLLHIDLNKSIKILIIIITIPRSWQPSHFACQPMYRRAIWWAFESQYTSLSRVQGWRWIQKPIRASRWRQFRGTTSRVVITLVKMKDWRRPEMILVPKSKNVDISFFTLFSCLTIKILALLHGDKELVQELVLAQLVEVKLYLGLREERSLMSVLTSCRWHKNWLRKQIK